jgi:hypothetical protein
LSGDNIILWAAAFDARRVAVYNHAEMSRNTISPFNNHGPLLRPLSVDTFKSNPLFPSLSRAVSGHRLDLRLGGCSPLGAPLSDDETDETNSDYN